MPSLTLITAPTEEPITIQQAKDELRGAPLEHDDHVRGLIVGARKYCEAVLKRQFVSATWDYRIDYFPGWEICLPLPPLQSVTSITYIDTGGTSTVLSSSTYSVDQYSEPGRITPAFNQSWPSTRWINNAVTIRFVAGYGAATAVPEPIKTAMKLHVRMTYEGCDGDAILRAIDGVLSSEYWGCYA